MSCGAYMHALRWAFVYLDVQLQYIYCNERSSHLAVTGCRSISHHLLPRCRGSSYASLASCMLGSGMPWYPHLCPSDAGADMWRKREEMLSLQRE